MFKINMTNEELEIIKSKIKFTEREERIIEYRRLNKSIVEMALLEHCDTRTIDREIRNIVEKFKKVNVVK